MWGIGGGVKKKNMKAGVNDDLKNVLFELFQHECAYSIPNDKPSLCAKATEFAAKMAISGFKA
jgi:hypothetical protein